MSVETQPTMQKDGMAAGRKQGILSIGGNVRLDPAGQSIQSFISRASRHRSGKRVKDLLDGTWMGHPLHPALVDIPIGAWTTATIFDAITVAGKKDFNSAAKTALSIGAVGAIGAAVSGLADWADTRGAQRRIGLVHAAMNVAALSLQLFSLFNRRKRADMARALSLAGLGVAAASAYLGGDLVFRLGTQVSRTAWNHGPSGFVPVLAADKLVNGRPTRVEVDGLGVMLVREGDNSVYALDDVCSHAGCSLSDGQVKAGSIICACHGSTFRLCDGKVLHGPSPFAQPSFDVRVDQGQILIRRR